MDFSIIFIKIFFLGIAAALPLFLFFIFTICTLGIIIGRREKWSDYDAIYYAFVTATTVGYGDFRPVEKINKFLAVIIAFMGLAFTGIFVSVAVNAATVAFKSTQDTELLQVELEEAIKEILLDTSD